MVAFCPNHLQKWSKGEWNTVPSDCLSGFSIDTRKIQRGDVFVAIRSARDGHNYLDSAQLGGAAAALVEEVNPSIDLPQLKVKNTPEAFLEIAHGHRRQFNKPVVGVTGSCGKTSTKEALATLLNNALSTEGNLNNHLGVPLTLLRLELDQHTAAIIEVGINQPGEMSPLTQTIDPDLVLVTMIGHSHLEGLGGIEGVAREKSKIWQDTNAKAIFPEACLNYQPFSRLVEQGKPHLVVKKGSPLEEKVGKQTAYYDFWTETNKPEGSGMLHVWHPESSELSCSLPPMSEGMIGNMALCVLAALELGLSEEEISVRLPQYKPPALRGARLQGRGREYFLDCYNSNPSSFSDSVRFFTVQSGNLPKLFILGGMEELGQEEVSLHRHAASHLELGEDDRVVLVGDKASWMADTILENGARSNQVIVLRSVEDCRSLVEDFEGNVLIKGSRRYRLEDILPSWAVAKEEEANAVLC